MADFGVLSSLGLGSQGILNNDLIDKLKDADKASIVTPIENKKNELIEKKNELDEIKKLMSDLNKATTDMTYDTPYESVEIDTSGSSISVSTTGSVKPDNFTIDVTNIATKDIYESSDNFTTKDATLQAGTFSISIGDNTFDIDINEGDTLQDLVNNINKNTDSKVEASILNVGGDNPYKLIVKSAETGEANRITISTDSDSFTNGLSRIGDPAKDAVFSFNGVTITRSSNKIDDLIDNVHIELKESGKTEVTIIDDNTKIIDGIKNFVEKYNEVAKKIKEDTKYDSENKSAGIFQGNSAIRDILRNIQDIITTTVSKDKKMARDFGLELQRDGTLSFDENKFKSAYNENREQTIEFFKASDATSGLFNKLEDKLYDIVISSKGTIKTLKKSLEDDIKRYEKLQKDAEERLERRYNILAKKFASYDEIMGKLNQSSNLISQLIEAELAQKNK